VNDDELLELLTEAIPGDASTASHGFRVALRGEVDAGTAHKLADTLDALVDDGAKLVVLDASDVEFLDSSGLRVIVNTGVKLSNAGGRLLIEGMSGAVQRVLEVSGLLEQYRS
jgi:anti-sigma B factor antagonist